MGTTALGRMAGDLEEVPGPAGGGGWMMVVPMCELAGHLWMEEGAAPIYSRAAREAALVLRWVSFPRRGAGRCRNSPGKTDR